jgi:tetratricopeptide (TPR) repeat protein
MASDPKPDDTIAAANTQPVVGAYVTIDTQPFERTDGSELRAVDPENYTERVVMTEGGMGRIITAWDRRLRRTVALKELRTQSASLRTRFEREALLTARLEHPSIVSVHEAGCWPSGEPFYAMRLVAGRALDQVVACAKSADERVALVPHVIAVADALAYAHKKRLIHRDLKPQNVLVGEFGETVVIDWGLVKDLADPNKTEPPRRPAPTSGSDHATTEGEILGTPAYMPPEQAEGDAVDERADVYAIGAILYHVLAGRAPYTASASLAVLEAVRSGPPPPLDPGLQPDLLAIVARAMARNPDARYPTARELSEDLRRFQAGQLVGAHRYSRRQLLRRWLRRHRTAVIVATIAIAALIIVGVASIEGLMREQHRAEAERRRAETERGLAEQSRADAEELMQFMLGDLRDKLEPIGKLELLAPVANKATEYYRQRPDARDPASQRKRAMSLGYLADVQVAHGELPAALASYREALAVREQLAAEAPSDAKLQRDVAVTDARIAKVLLAQGDTRGALAAHQAALAIRELLAARDPKNLQWQRELAYGHGRVGKVQLQQGDAKAALAAYRMALAIDEKLVAADPSNADWRRDVSVMQEWISDVLTDRGDLPGALTAARASLALREQAAAKTPQDPAAQRDLSVSQEKLGNVLLAQHDVRSALAAYRAALEISERLAARDPDNATWQRDLSVSHEKLGDVLLQTGDATGSLAANRAALAIRERLAAQDRSNAESQRDVAGSYAGIAGALDARHDAAGARAAYRTALEISERLAAKDPTNAELGADIAKLRRLLESCCKR